MSSIYTSLPGVGYPGMPMFSQGDYGAPISAPLAADVPRLPSKAELDGTNAFGLNSVPGAYALSTMEGSPASAAAGSWWDSPFLKSMIGTKEAPGWGGMAVGGASALMNGFLGLKQYGLAKDALATNKKQFQMNYDAQKTTTNTALEDRQRARTASNPGAYQSVGDYMSQHRIA